MTEPSLEELFRRFRATADPRALAAVYDRVAPELLLAAVHLGQREGDAEDLLHATFVAAIEGAHRYDPSRPLLPWLIGILGTKAKRQWRERRRRPDPERVRSSGHLAPDPVQAAADAEFAEEFARQLGSLPAGYRQALTLRFVHGLTPTQIAHSLGEPVDTIKTRLKRGTRILRSALPAGFAATLLAAVAPARDLASIRASVLAHAEAARAARVGGRGALAMLRGSRVLPTVGFALLTVAIAWVAVRGAIGALDPVEPRAPASENVDTLAHEASSAVARRDVADPTDTTAYAVLRVRFADGDPGVGVRVLATRRGAPDPLLTAQELVADADGVIPIAELPEGEWRFVALRGGSIDARLGSVDERGTELVVPPGIDVRGRVHDAGAPIAGATILVSGTEHADEVRGVVRTDENGRFALRSLAPGRAISVLADGYTPRPLERIDGEPGTARELDVDLALQRSAWSLTGRIVDERGEPVSGACVQIGRRLPFLDFDNEAVGPESRVPPTLVRTDADGRFARAGFYVFDGVLETWARAPGFAVTHRSVAFAAAEPRVDVEIRLVRGRTVEGRLELEDGSPAAGARVETNPLAARAAQFAPRFAAAVAWSDPDGRYSIEGAGRGEVVLRALAPDGSRASTRVPAGGDRSWDGVLCAPRMLRGFVVDPRGAPIEGLAVRALVDAGREEPRAARTDARGAFTIEGCDTGPHTLWITDPASPWTGRVAAQPGVHAGHGATQLVVRDELRSTATIVGRVVDTEGAPLAADLALGNLRVGRTYMKNDPVTGRFEIGPLPALAHWEVLTRDADHRWTGRNGIVTRPHEATEVGDLVIAEPGRVRVRVRDREGVPIDAATVTVVAADGTECGAFELSNGTGRSRPLPPGEHVLWLAHGALSPTPTRFTVASGEVTEVELSAERGVAHVFAFDHEDDGWDLRLALELRREGETESVRERLQLTRGEPYRVRRALRPGRWELRAVSHSGRRARLEIDVVAGSPPAGSTPIRLE